MSVDLPPKSTTQRAAQTNLRAATSHRHPAHRPLQHTVRHTVKMATGSSAFECHFSEQEDTVIININAQQATRNVLLMLRLHHQRGQT